MGNRLQFLPLIGFILFPTTFIISYTIALSYDHIYPVYAYISDTGTLSPESCWFSLFLSLTAGAIAGVVFVRYKQIQLYFRDKGEVWTDRHNIISMVIGMISALGVVIVGAFQETNVISMHIVGAFMSFLVGSFYLIYQGYFTFKMLPAFTSTFIAWARLIIGITCTILFIVTYACGVISVAGFEGSNILKWEPTEPKYALRITSVTCEWTMAALFDIYILSFMLDFRKINVKSLQVKCVEAY